MSTNPELARNRRSNAGYPYARFGACFLRSWPITAVSWPQFMFKKASSFRMGKQPSSRFIEPLIESGRSLGLSLGLQAQFCSVCCYGVAPTSIDCSMWLSSAREVGLVQRMTLRVRFCFAESMGGCIQLTRRRSVTGETHHSLSVSLAPLETGFPQLPPKLYTYAIQGLAISTHMLVPRQL